MNREIISKEACDFVELIKQHNVTDSNTIKYIKLYSNFNNTGIASYKRIAKTLGVEPDSVFNILKPLKDMGALATTRRSKFSCNLYYDSDSDSDDGGIYIAFNIHPKILKK